ncbi:hypothetical protein BMS3Abin17_01022 [archaeon BMS3Abin17]|nr:hypothetical protein BMS3Abin17_01022 [archaeon BMS3Abin17]
MYFRSIKKTKHYKEHPEQNFPWSKVIGIILTAKNKRKKEDKIEIKTKNHYILCQLKNNILGVINAKQTK